MFNFLLKLSVCSTNVQPKITCNCDVQHEPSTWESYSFTIAKEQELVFAVQISLTIIYISENQSETSHTKANHTIHPVTVTIQESYILILADEATMNTTVQYPPKPLTVFSGCLLVWLAMMTIWPLQNQPSP